MVVDTAAEVGLVALGIGCMLLFAGCALSACVCGRDVNWQERRPRDDRVAYLGRDDRWYAGVRRPLRADVAGWILWLRGRVAVEARDGDLLLLPTHAVIEIDNLFRPSHLRHYLPQHRPPTDIEDGSAPLVGNLMRAYTPLWSFIINNAIIGLSTAVGFEVRLSSSVSPWAGFAIVFGTTFTSGVVIMTAFFYLFGFGEAMLAPRRPKVLSTELAHELFGNRVSVEPGEAMVITETNQVYGPRLRFNYVSKVYLEEPRVPASFRSRRRA